MSAIMISKDALPQLNIEDSEIGSQTTTHVA